MIDENFQDVLKELRTIFSQIQGVKNVGEDFVLNYLILTDGEDSKKNVLKVAEMLKIQAEERHNINLDIYVLTAEEFEKANTPTFETKTKEK